MEGPAKSQTAECSSALAFFVDSCWANVDGSTVHIRYREPQRMLAMPIDLDTLTPEELRARLRKREAQLQRTKEYEQELSDDFDVECYRQFWWR
ncbi:39S ribosomal protein L55, mitochondrial, partial [Saguinus oedipus]